MKAVSLVSSHLCSSRLCHFIFQDSFPILDQVVGKNHPEFGSSRQQDSQEFFMHLLDQIEKHHQKVGVQLTRLRGGEHD